MNNKGNWLFWGGAVLTVVSILLGNSLQEALRAQPIEVLMQARDPLSLRILGFAFGFPLGVGISLLGALIGSGASSRQVWLFVGVVVAGILSAGLVPKLFGRELSAAYFGTGGYLIMLLVLGLIWVWGRVRAVSPQATRSGIDLQGLGYLCFAFAAWNLCGAATMPSFSLEPEMMLAMGAQAFAIGQMKTIMALFVLGWALSLSGLWMSFKSLSGKK